MSDPTEPTATTDTESPDQKQAAAALSNVMDNRFWDLLDVLVPEGKTSIEATDGNVYELPTVLPARRQVKVLRQLRQLWEMQADNDAFAAMRAGFAGGDMVSGIGSAMEALEDPRVFEALDQAMFKAFGPDESGQGVLAELLGEHKACDVFPLEEVVASLVPFFVKMLRRFGETLQPLTAMTQTVASIE